MLISRYITQIIIDESISNLNLTESFTGLECLPSRFPNMLQGQNSVRQCWDNIQLHFHIEEKKIDVGDLLIFVNDQRLTRLSYS